MLWDTFVITIAGLSYFCYNSIGDYVEELKLCKEIIKKVKWYMERKDYAGLRLYIDEKEKEVEKNL